MKEELNLVKKKIYSELVVRKEGNIYEPHKFREFCISAGANKLYDTIPVSYTHLRAHETDSYLVCRLLLEKKKK